MGFRWKDRLDLELALGKFRMNIAEISDFLGRHFDFVVCN